VDPDGNSFLDAVPSTIAAGVGYVGIGIARVGTEVAVLGVRVFDKRAAIQARRDINNAFGSILKIQTGIAATAVTGDAIGIGVNAISAKLLSKSAATGAEVAEEVVGASKRTLHKNSLSYEGETHVYRIKNADGTTYKIGESAQGTRVRDGASIRAEQQVRKLNREVGPGHSSEIRETFPNKAAARDYETRLIERYRRMYGQDTLPGNKTNR
jgi:hypothetical protein